MELNTIRCCDCLDGMREIPDKSIDLVITDPPYGIGEAAGKNKNPGRQHGPGRINGKRIRIHVIFAGRSKSASIDRE